MDVERYADTTAALKAAVRQTGGWDAAAAMLAAGKLHGISPQDAVLEAATGVVIPGRPAETAYAGTALLLRCGAGKPEILSAASWQRFFQESRCISQTEDPESAFIQVLLCFGDFLSRQTDGPKLPQTYYEQIYTDRDAMFRHSPYALEEKLSKAVTRGDRKAAVAALREISRQGDKAVVARDPLRSAKNSMIGSIAFLARATIQAGVNADNAFALSDCLIQHIEDMTGQSEVLKFEEQILLRFMDLVDARLATAYSVSITRVMHYIENHLNQKISLSDAASYAGIHPAYLSARFRQETGIPFSRFVTVRKIQESSYFVRHTHYSISQIALLYGFSSQSYYITAFKRVMDMTPMEFRSRYLSN